LDCCRAGRVPLPKDVDFESHVGLSQSLGAFDQGEGRVILAASGPDGYAYVDRGARNGVFTGYLLDGLRGQCGGHEGLICVDDLYAYIQGRLAVRKILAPMIIVRSSTLFAVALYPDRSTRASGDEVDAATALPLGAAPSPSLIPDSDAWRQLAGV